MDAGKQYKKAFHPLTDAKCRSVKHTDRPPRAFDGQGLYLEARKTKKVWMFKTKLKGGKPILLTLGEYPAITLSEARQKREELREQIAKGLDPRQVEKDRIQAEQARQASTLEKVTAEWLEVRKGKVQDDTLHSIQRKMEKHVFPVIGSIPVTDITARDVLDLLQAIEKQKTANMARNVKSILSRVFSFAIQLGVTDRNPASDLITRDVLKRHVTTHHKAIGIDELPDLLGKIEADNACLQVKSALHMIVMLFMRKGEVRNAEWSHIDLKAGLWTVPAGNTKKDREQVYPLPRQAVAILNELHFYTGAGRYVFSTGKIRKDAPLGATTINTVISRIGYHGKMTPHGFRALASSWLDEQGYSRQAVERQLSHLEQGQTNQAYHRADYMEERREMLQAWADHLDSIKEQETQQQGDKAA